MTAPLLEVAQLSVLRGGAPVLRDISLSVDGGSRLGVFGGVGSGKSTLLDALAGNLGDDCAAQGVVKVQGQTLSHGDVTAWRELRGRVVGFVPQDTQSKFDGDIAIGTQLLEIATLHGKGTGKRARSAVSAALELVGAADAEGLKQELPHQVPLGSLQKAALAAALLCEPRLLVMENPVAHLDAPARERVMSVVHQRCREKNVGVLLLSSDPSDIIHHTDRALVLHAGEVVERGTTAAVFGGPIHPYTVAALVAYSTPKRVTTHVASAGSASPNACSYYEQCAVRAAPPPSQAEHTVRCGTVHPGFSMGNRHEYRCHLKLVAGEEDA